MRKADGKRPEVKSDHPFIGRTDDTGSKAGYKYHAKYHADCGVHTLSVVYTDPVTNKKIELSKEAKGSGGLAPVVLNVRLIDMDKSNITVIKDGASELDTKGNLVSVQLKDSLGGNVVDKKDQIAFVATADKDAKGADPSSVKYKLVSTSDELAQGTYKYEFTAKHGVYQITLKLNGVEFKKKTVTMNVASDTIDPNIGKFLVHGGNKSYSKDDKYYDGDAIEFVLAPLALGGINEGKSIPDDIKDRLYIRDVKDASSKAIKFTKRGNVTLPGDKVAMDVYTAPYIIKSRLDKYELHVFYNDPYSGKEVDLSNGAKAGLGLSPISLDVYARVVSDKSSIEVVKDYVGELAKSGERDRIIIHMRDKDGNPAIHAESISFYPNRDDVKWVDVSTPSDRQKGDAVYEVTFKAGELTINKVSIGKDQVINKQVTLHVISDTPDNSISYFQINKSNSVVVDDGQKLEITALLKTQYAGRQYPVADDITDRLFIQDSCGKEIKEFKFKGRRPVTHSADAGYVNEYYAPYSPTHGHHILRLFYLPVGAKDRIELFKGSPIDVTVIDNISVENVKVIRDNAGAIDKEGDKVSVDLKNDNGHTFSYTPMVDFSVEAKGYKADVSSVTYHRISSDDDARKGHLLFAFNCSFGLYHLIPKLYGKEFKSKGVDINILLDSINPEISYFQINKSNAVNLKKNDKVMITLLPLALDGSNNGKAIPDDITSLLSIHDECGKSVKVIPFSGRRHVSNLSDAVFVNEYYADYVATTGKHILRLFYKDPASGKDMEISKEGKTLCPITVSVPIYVNEDKTKFDVICNNSGELTPNLVTLKLRDNDNKPILGYEGKISLEITPSSNPMGADASTVHYKLVQDNDAEKGTYIYNITAKHGIYNVTPKVDGKLLTKKTVVVKFTSDYPSRNSSYFQINKFIDLELVEGSKVEVTLLPLSDIDIFKHDD